MPLRWLRSLVLLSFVAPSIIFAGTPKSCVSADEASKMLNKDVCVTAHIYDVVELPTEPASSTYARRTSPMIVAASPSSASARIAPTWASY